MFQFLFLTKKNGVIDHLKALPWGFIAKLITPSGIPSDVRTCLSLGIAKAVSNLDSLFASLVNLRFCNLQNQDIKVLKDC